MRVQVVRWRGWMTLLKCSPGVHHEFSQVVQTKRKAKVAHSTSAVAAEMKHLGAEGMIARAHWPS